MASTVVSQRVMTWRATEDTSVMVRVRNIVHEIYLDQYELGFIGSFGYALLLYPYKKRGRTICPQVRSLFCFLFVQDIV